VVSIFAQYLRAIALQEKHDTLDTRPLQGRVLNMGGKSGAFSEDAEVANNLATTVAEGVLAASAVNPQVLLGCRGKWGADA
jgi:hypothetical protein